MPTPFHQVLLRDRRSLQRGLSDPALPHIRDLREELRRLARETDIRQTDTVLNQLEESLFQHPSEGIGDLLLRMLADTAKDLLDLRDRNLLTIRHGRLGDWQTRVTDCPPILLVARRLLEVHGPPPVGGVGASRELSRYFHWCIRPQVHHSVLPLPHDPRIEEIVEREGLDDLHIHLNGSTETEHVFLEALARPHGFLNEVVAVANRIEVKRQFEQEERGLTPSGLLRRIRTYRTLRRVLAQAALTGTLPDLTPQANPELPPFLFTRPPEVPSPWRPRANRHPIDEYFGTNLGSEPGNCLALETLLWMYLLQCAGTHQDLRYAPALHVYLLGFAQFHRLLVQQIDQYGFDQFQSITINGMREDAEKSYALRFHQADREGELSVIEARLAPKEGRDRLGLLLTRVGEGWARFSGVRPIPRHLREAMRALRPSAMPSLRAQARLVFHFVKKKDKTPRGAARGTPTRHRTLRRSLDVQWHVLRQLIKSYPDILGALSGFDAAANELHAPPEVFAPVYRAIRAFGLGHFTYHVGEDFVHLLSGLRAMWEAIFFLELGPGDRLGHGTVMGIEPACWQAATPRKLTMHLHDRLDDLVFARRLFLDSGFCEGLGLLEDEIARCSREIYSTAHPPALLHEAWALRSLDPRLAHALGPTAGNALIALTRHRQDEIERCRSAAQTNPEAWRLFLQYHDPEFIRKGRKYVLVDSVADRAPLDAPGLRRLQEQLAAEVRRHKLAVEVLPTSNVRISVYQRHGEHHVLRWLGLSGDVPIPVVLGTDDPGVFATSIRTEYTHLLEVLDQRCPGKGEEAVRHIETLVRNAKRYRFRTFDRARSSATTLTPSPNAGPVLTPRT